MSTLPPVTRAAADIGGTFTDIAVVTPDGRLATRKLPSTPANYADAVIAGVRGLLGELGSPPAALEELLHGCTGGDQCNPRREGRADRPAHHPGISRRAGAAAGAGAEPVRAALRTPAAARAAAASLRDRRADRTARGGSPPPRRGRRAHRRRVHPGGRHRGGGGLLSALLHQPPPTSGAPARFSARCSPAPSSRSRSDVLPQKLEYERTSTTVINAYVGPPVERYVRSMVEQTRAAGIGGRLMVIAVERRHPRRGRGRRESGADRRVWPGRGGSSPPSTSRRAPASTTRITLDMGGHHREGGRSSSGAGSPSPTNTRSAAACRRGAPSWGEAAMRSSCRSSTSRRSARAADRFAWLDKARLAQGRAAKRRGRCRGRRATASATTSRR